MGLCDSVNGVTELGSTADAKALVILVLNGERINRTLRTIIRGLKRFDSQVEINGFVLTNVAPKQAEKLIRSRRRLLSANQYL
jgi:cobyrinic acid a,c-diamide synthase